MGRNYYWLLLLFGRSAMSNWELRFGVPQKIIPKKYHQNWLDIGVLGNVILWHWMDGYWRFDGAWVRPIYAAARPLIPTKKKSIIDCKRKNWRMPLNVNILDSHRHQLEENNYWMQNAIWCKSLHFTLICWLVGPAARDWLSNFFMSRFGHARLSSQKIPPKLFGYWSFGECQGPWREGKWSVEKEGWLRQEYWMDGTAGYPWDCAKKHGVGQIVTVPVPAQLDFVLKSYAHLKIGDAWILGQKFR